MPVRSSISKAVMRAVALDADPPFTTMVPGVDIGVEAFDPVGDKLDRPPQQLRQRIGRHFVGVDMYLDAEGAADVLADHADLLFCEAEVKGRDILHHVRRLRALIDREPRFCGIPVGDDSARLQRHAGVTAEDELRLHDLIGIGKSLIDVSGIMSALEGKIIAERRMNDRSLRIERGTHIRDCVELSILDKDGLGGVLGKRATGRDHGRDGFALPADAIDRDGVLRRRFEAF